MLLLLLLYHRLECDLVVALFVVFHVVADSAPGLMDEVSNNKILCSSNFS